MKELLTCILCCALALSMVSCDNANVSPPEMVSSGVATNASSIGSAAEGTVNLEETESENEMAQGSVEMGLAINGTYFSVPSELKQFVDDGWTISAQAPYFLCPMVGEYYYETRANWSLSQDGKGILPGGSIIRLLEKDGVLLEVIITNLTSEEDGPDQRIEDGTVTSVTARYDDTCTSIALNEKELNSITPETLVEDYPTEDGWTHAPNDYRAYPELGVSTDYLVMYSSGSGSRSIEIYFDLDNKASKVQIVNEQG